MKARPYKVGIGPDYFKVLGIPVLQGRAFTDHDSVDSPGVVIISESLARRAWPNQDAIGKRMNIGFGGETWREVVGVVLARARVGQYRRRDVIEEAAPLVVREHEQSAFPLR